MILEFDEDGLLPAGDYPMTIDELRSSMLVKGPGTSTCPDWDVRWRLRLVENMAILAGQLWTAGIEAIFIDGSFVEDKDHPKDIDGYFETNTYQWAKGHIQATLNRIEPIWTWRDDTRRPHRESAKRELPMWHKYRVEFWPSYLGGPTLGIRDEHGNDLPIAAAFRKSRRHDRLRGIIKLEKK